MATGALVTIAVQKPANLSIVIQDNEHYGETGMQETATRYGADLAGMAKAAGIPRTMLVTRPDDVPALRAAIHAGGGTLFAVAKVAAATLPMVLPPREGAYLQARFREAVLGPAAHHQLQLAARSGGPCASRIIRVGPSAGQDVTNLSK